MPDPTFHLIFDSRQVAANQHKALKQRLQDRLGLDGSALARLFSGTPVVIRRDLDAHQGKRFLERLSALGAPCRLAAQVTPQGQEALHLSDSLVVCPKCQHSQSPAMECRRCGLIFHKYRTGQPAHRASEPLSGVARSAQQGAPPADAPAESPPTRTSKVGALLASYRDQLEARILRRRTKEPQASMGARGAPPYLQAVWHQGIRLLLYATIALLLLVTGLYFARGLWGLYTATQVGERYLAEFPEKAQAIVTMLGQHSLVLPLATIVATLLVCTSLACLAQFLHLGRYFYENRPWWWCLLIWYLPLAAAIGMVLVDLGLAPSMKLGGSLALLPTLCLAPAAFDLGHALICEFGDLLGRFGTLLHRPMIQLRERIASHLDR